MMALLSSKGKAIEVIAGGTDKPMKGGGTQEIDIQIAAHDPLGRSAEFFIELYSGAGDPKSKKEQLDRYASAASAHKISIAIFTKSDGADHFTTKNGLSVLRMDWSALQAMSGTDLSRLLFEEYARFRAQIENHPPI